MKTIEIENLIKNGTPSDFLGEVVDKTEPPEVYMKKLMEEKNIKIADIVNACNLERSYVYHMLSGKRRPTRKFLLSFGIAAGLSVEEEQRLLKIADRSPLYVRRRYDSVIYYALENSMNIRETNKLLYEVGERLL